MSIQGHCLSFPFNCYKCSLCLYQLICPNITLISTITRSKSIHPFVSLLFFPFLVILIHFFFLFSSEYTSFNTRSYTFLTTSSFLSLFSSVYIPIYLPFFIHFLSQHLSIFLPLTPSYVLSSGSREDRRALSPYRNINPRMTYATFHLRHVEIPTLYPNCVKC